jgi:hypothetical protein
MRLALGRRNENDPDSNDTILRQYLDDFIHLTMSEDVKLFEQYGTLSFAIDDTNTTGVYIFNDVGATSDFTNISQEAFITLTVPPAGSISWNRLYIFQDPGEFYSIWGIDNTDILIPGYPTHMLYYGNQMVFRTIPNTAYTVNIYGYKIYPGFGAEEDPEIPYDYWVRYISYGAALNYARDFRYDPESIGLLKSHFSSERKIVLTRTHNQVKGQRALPRF